MSSTRDRTLAAALAIGAALASTACGAADAGGEPDGGVTTYCTMVVAVTPAAPEAPATVSLEGSITREGSVFGTESYQFSVTFDDTAVATSELDPYDGSRVSFDAPTPGPYRVELRGSVGATACTDGVEWVNVSDPSAGLDSFRFRFAPAAGQPAPMQERVFAIPGGADYSLGTVGLDSGVEVNGYVRDASAAPLAAYLRVAPTGGDAHATEVFADDAGAFHARLEAGTYDVLVVPDSGAVAPELRASLGLSALGLLTLSPGDSITGVVLGPGGTPLEGARVSLRIDDVPSAIATTDAAGAFSVLARAGGATAVTVNPPAGSGLPRLEVDASAGLVAASGTPLNVAYSAALSSRALSLDVMRSDAATPAPGARVTFIARPLAVAGSVTPQGGTARSARGELRITAEADAGGSLPALSLPETVYDVVVEPPVALTGEAIRLAEVDLSPGEVAPTTLALAQPATLTGSTVDDAQVGIAGVTVSAVPRGLLANATRAFSTATTAADGTFAIAVVGEGEYDLVLEPRGAGYARARSSGVLAPAAGGSQALAAIELPNAIAVTGSVDIPGVAGGAAGVHVMALCYDCTGVTAAAPLADAVTDTAGNFVLALPDPGVSE